MNDQPMRPSAGDESGTKPIGTLFILAIYIALLAGMWGAVYWLLLHR